MEDEVADQVDVAAYVARHATHGMCGAWRGIATTIPFAPFQVGWILTVAKAAPLGGIWRN
jgi:hypothetical protein